MIGTIITVGIAFIWLGYETDWMRVRLPCGAQQSISSGQGIEVNKQPKRQWQFLKYGDDCIMMRDRCYVSNCHLCRQGDRFFAWRIPARIVKLYGSTINFKAGCNLYRANIIRKVVRAQKSKAMPTYHANGRVVSLPLPPGYQAKITELYFEPSLELLVDGKLVANVDGNYKRGDISKALKPYTTKARVGRQSVILPVGEAGRVVTK